MANGLPPLATLRAFEAAARAGRFTQAAKALNVTQGAISHQIKSLEEQLGVKLFVREPQGLVLTLEGKRLSRAVTQAFDILETELDQIRQQSIVQKNTLTVKVCSSFATKWLIRRLSDLNSCYSDISLKIIGSERAVSFDPDKCDAAIIYGNGQWVGAESTLIHRDTVFPVCSPRLVQSGKLRLDELTSYPLLHDDDDLRAFDYGLNWDSWLDRAGVRRPAPASAAQVRYSQSSLGIQAAIEGHGIALARGLIVGDDLADGRLIRPVEQSFPAVLNLYFVRPAGARASRAADTLRCWLFENLYRKQPELSEP
jgi:LysR family glycine cleavage system transcriptional activator